MRHKQSKDFKDSWIQRSWEYDVQSYFRNKKMLALAQKLNHQAGIDYCTKAIADLEKQYPSLKKGICNE